MPGFFGQISEINVAAPIRRLGDRDGRFSQAPLCRPFCPWAFAFWGVVGFPSAKSISFSQSFGWPGSSGCDSARGLYCANSRRRLQGAS